MSYNFLNTGILYPWLGLFLVFYSLWSNCEWDCFLNFPFIVCFWHIKMQLISGYLFCILLLCWIHWSVVVVSLWDLWGFLCIVSCHLQIKTALLLPFQFGSLLFLLLVWFLWLGLLVLCWIREGKEHILVLFQILRGTLVNACWVWCSKWVCHIWSFYV